MYSQDNRGSILPACLKPAVGTTTNDLWQNLLVEGKYLPSQHITNGSVLAHNSAFLCPATPEVITDSSTMDGFWTVASTATETTGAPSYTPTLYTQTSYGINGTYSVGQNPPPSAYDISKRNVTLWFPTYGIDLSNPQPNVKVGQIRNTSQVAFIFDGLYINPVATDIRIYGRHFRRGRDASTGTTNVLLLDGHVQSYPRKQLPSAADGAAFWTNDPRTSNDRVNDPMWKVVVSQR